MTASAIERDPELQRVLWACYRYWQAESLPTEDRAVCYGWVVRPYEEAFGTQFHQSRLARLTKFGFLQQAETSRGGKRRYYTMANPERIGELLKQWNLN